MSKNKNNLLKAKFIPKIIRDNVENVLICLKINEILRKELKIKNIEEFLLF